MKNGVSGMLRRMALVQTEVSEELSASIIRVTRIGEVGKTLAVTNNRRTLRRNTLYCYIRFEDFSAVTMKNDIFLAIKPSSYLTNNTLRLRYRVQTINPI
jgi:hypothetical protein